MDELLDRLETVAEQMNACKRSWFAKLNYDMMADALWWSDERPDFADAEDHWCLRPLFRYRTTLILDAPESQWLPFWDRSLELFPDWPGFHHSRTKPDSKLAAYHSRKHDIAISSLGDIPD
ncbi:hypothetical protein [Rhodopirellula sp. SWK7]|uniref:hypothetical protein n=1 Tax=Rhodopirellula sp. SWK7 TaxID=595460 RepID=UPI0002BDE800|nr:hypothetical protein [Rhodopirellula sp. SWK7]EMI45182.1 hypothetical protein RRSWK_02312 [Rhodopirellula sp. SWK7]